MLVEGTFIIEKMSGKGGWHFVLLPDLKPDAQSPFGWLNVFGIIDTYEISNYNLQPFGNGQLFLPINAKIRRRIKKINGDNVYIKLFQTLIDKQDRADVEACFSENTIVLENWLKLSDAKQNKILADIFRAKNEDEKARRLLKYFEKFEKLEKLEKLEK